MWQTVSHNEQETAQIAAALAQTAFAGMCIALWGDLGAGKTAFVKGLAAGLHSQGRVRSPTFALLHEHPGQLTLYHFDLYRLEGMPLEEGLVEYFYGDGVCAIEWPQMAGAELPAARLDVHIAAQDAQTRCIRMEAFGAQHVRALERMTR